MKYIKNFESLSFEVPYDYSSYTCVYNEDIIPDTDYGVYKKYSETGSNSEEVMIKESDLTKIKDVDLYYFEGVAVTNSYYRKASKAKREYEEIKSYNDGVRSSDDQYDDPNEWSAADNYRKYYNPGNWSDLFWKFHI